MGGIAQSNIPLRAVTDILTLFSLLFALFLLDFLFAIGGITRVHPARTCLAYSSQQMGLFRASTMVTTALMHTPALLSSKNLSFLIL